MWSVRSDDLSVFFFFFTFIHSFIHSFSPPFVFGVSWTVKEWDSRPTLAL